MPPSNQHFTHTVVCFTDANRREHFYNIGDAVAYANNLLRQGLKCKIYAYSAPMRPVDYDAQRLERDGSI